MNIGQSDDDRLVARFRDGDRDALASLYRMHHPAIFRFALYMTNDPDAAAEVVQDTFLWLIHHPAAFDPDRGFLRSFLSGVARKLLQRRARDRRRFEPLSAAPQPIDETITAGIDADTDARNLRSAIVELPEVYREVVVLCGIENKTYEEAAAILDCAVGTVRSRLYRAKAQLGHKLTRSAEPKMAAAGRTEHA